MRIHRFVALAALILVCGVRTGTAQEQRKVGITMGYPSAFGIHWQVNEKVAVRPQFTITGSSSESASGSFSGDTESSAIGVSVGVLFYLGSYDHVRTYFTPQFSYGHGSSESTTSSVTKSTSESTSDAYGATGSFGAQYNPTDRFSVYGEFGFGFAHTSTETGNSLTKVKSDTWGTRSAVGVIFFF